MEFCSTSVKNRIWKIGALMDSSANETVKHLQNC